MVVLLCSWYSALLALTIYEIVQQFEIGEGRREQD